MRHTRCKRRFDVIQDIAELSCFRATFARSREGVKVLCEDFAIHAGFVQFCTHIPICTIHVPLTYGKNAEPGDFCTRLVQLPYRLRICLIHCVLNAYQTVLLNLSAG